MFTKFTPYIYCCLYMSAVTTRNCSYNISNILNAGLFWYSNCTAIICVTPRICKLVTDMRRLTTGIRSEKCVVREISSLCERHIVYLHKPRQYSIAYCTIWYSLLLLDYKPVQHVTVLNTVGNCNTVVLHYYNIMEPPSYMRSVVDRNVVMRRMTSHATNNNLLYVPLMKQQFVVTRRQTILQKREETTDSQ
jgi:hypothetical protein